jgi:hypothetical protein
MQVAACCSYFQDSLVEEIVGHLAAGNVDIHLWALEEARPAVSHLTRGIGRLGKPDVLNRLLACTSRPDLVLFIDDDVRLPADFLPVYLRAICALNASVAQPALARNSIFSHEITLQRPHCWARLTNFVETGPLVSMTPRFLELVAPFPTFPPQGWGLDVEWAAVAQRHGLRQVIVDACPVEHNFRPIASRYSGGEECLAMDEFFRQRGLQRTPHRVLRAYPIIPNDRTEYLRCCPPPAAAVKHGLGTDMEQDLPVLWAVASLLRPEEIVELGTRCGISTRTLVHAAAAWQGRVTTADPVDARPRLGDLDCECLPMTGEELFRRWNRPVQMLFVDTDPHSYEQTRGWLDTWVRTWLAEGGVAVFHDVCAARPEIEVARAVRDWLSEQPPIWRWQEIPGTWGLGILWRVGRDPPF